MILAEIGTTNWLVWGLIGIIGGYMAGRLLTGGGGAMWVRIIVGIIAALAGGYAFMAWFGNNDYGQTISLVGSVAVCAIVLWLVSIIFKSHPSDDDIE